ncbi:AP-5 complex subunit beta-1-like isoform X2 [Xenia sp. Carnegie-2017]|uniref:AP-5 complex subunit beta-1-like isoform X2 n=1 Tax=Xenia sp. Carnegie-2017 TaxID=2897299 RepID=UPI001F038A7F|nr:AP-5 complex subunit beta-1-like isoform X2 [Xenia sp. Carnegie-2017]
MDIDLENIKNIETFLLDSLDALCLESSSNVDKISLLSAFQEKIDWSSLDVTSAEHVIGSLKNMYVNPVKYDSEFYRSQLLVTITVVLVISSSKLMNQHKHCETLHHSIEFLSDIISKVNDVPSVLTRKTACECLLEIEQSYPGLLQDKLGCFLKLCEKEKTVLFQNYMILFVTTLKNALLHLSAFQNVDEENINCVSVLLNDEADVSLKMNGATEMRTIEEQFPITSNVIGGDCCDVVLPKTVKNKELKQAVSFIAENFHLLTNIPLFHVLFQLMQCIRLASLSPSVFKCQFVKSLFHTIDLPLFQIILLLQSTFKSQLFEEADVALLLQKLCQLSNQPSLGIYKRLLCFNWVIHFPYEAKPDKSLLIFLWIIWISKKRLNFTRLCSSQLMLYLQS